MQKDATSIFKLEELRRDYTVTSADAARESNADADAGFGCLICDVADAI